MPQCYVPEDLLWGGTVGCSPPPPRVLPHRHFLIKMLEELNSGEAKSIEHVRSNLCEWPSHSAVGPILGSCWKVDDTLRALVTAALTHPARCALTLAKAP